jgi:hypothetical protein
LRDLQSAQGVTRGGWGGIAERTKCQTNSECAGGIAKCAKIKGTSLRKMLSTESTSRQELLHAYILEKAPWGCFPEWWRPFENCKVQKRQTGSRRAQITPWGRPRVAAALRKFAMCTQGYPWRGGGMAESTKCQTNSQCGGGIAKCTQMEECLPGCLPTLPSTKLASHSGGDRSDFGKVHQTSWERSFAKTAKYKECFPEGGLAKVKRRGLPEWWGPCETCKAKRGPP